MKRHGSARLLGLKHFSSLLLASILCCANVALAEAPGSVLVNPSGVPVRGPIRPKSTAIPAPPPDKYELLQHSLFIYLPKVHTQAIFLGDKWRYPWYAGDKIDGIDQFYGNFESSTYARSIDEYRAFPGERTMDSDLDYSGHATITTLKDPLRVHYDDFTKLAYGICVAVNSGQLQLAKPPATTFFPVYLDRRRPAGEECSIHGFQQFGSFLCPGTPETRHRLFMLAMFYDLDGDNDCNIDDQVTGHSAGLAALANQTARTIADVHSDPYFASYYDQNLNEIDDKCAWTFQVPFVTFADGSTWKLQSLWSNKAYESGAGYPNQDGARGCVIGE